MGWAIGIAIFLGIAAWAALAQRVERLEKELEKARADAQRALELATQAAASPAESETDRQISEHQRDLKKLGIYPD